MSDNTHIEWADATWNPVVGCSAMSEGCTHCYAMKHAWRQQAMGTAHYAGLTRKSGGRALWTGDVRLAPEHILRQPLTWHVAKRIFVNAMSDLFHERLADGGRFTPLLPIFDVMAQCPQHSFQILTKRAELMHRFFTKGPGRALYPATANMWLGVSVENAAHTDRITLLRDIPMPGIRWLSLEPLLGPLPGLPLDGIDWVVVGGESGKAGDYRPMAPNWVRDIRAQCMDAGIPFFFKQWGTNNKKKAGHLLDGRAWQSFPITGRRGKVS